VALVWQDDSNLVGYQLSAAVYIVSSLFWDVTQRLLVIIYRRFGTTCRPHLLLLLDTPSTCKCLIGLRVLIKHDTILTTVYFNIRDWYFRHSPHLRHPRR